MASILEIIKTTSSIVPQFDGNIDKLKAFADALNLVKTFETPENKATIINVILTKLEGRARNAFTETPTSVSEISKILKAKITTSPPEQVLAKMANLKQNGGIEQFCLDLEKLVFSLETAYTAKEIPPQVAKSMANKEGVKHLAGGLKNEKTSLIIRAGNFNSYSDAMTKALEENLNNASASVFAYSQTNRNANRFNNNVDTHYNNYRRRPNDFHNRGRNQNNFNRNNFNQNNFQNQPRNNYTRFGQQNQVRDQFSNINPQRNNNNNNRRNTNFNRPQQYIRLTGNESQPTDALQSEPALTLEENKHYGDQH
ncbi:probable serine/threonine-protein kinase clkA [Toxorhynchites rutilus septentrionalis]|uniref:probable serine/threonine-protein kinase clkA n=1 Tax=Toxorhynchites rutilus septentrionalis TaxID=329112 RepID=UPI00247A6A84|nr:probable serine/threonine-protein kinase clkA [Toxorhynchites rutilus septentrionalis]XP_055644108.1 probable serine/threonine-protein kinase clkA [Toxorhynchites rutilus septentrionalis]